MALAPRFLDELRNRITLSEVIGRRIKLIRAGREHHGLCPFHTEKSPSFTVNDQKGFFHCFGCGAHGDVISFLMRHDNLSFPEAVDVLAAQVGLAVPTASPDEKERYSRQKTLHDLLEQATRWFESQLQTPAARTARAYLQQRGLDDTLIARFRLGFAPVDAAALRSYLLAAGFSDSQMVEAGLTRQPDDGRPPYAFFRNRILFPVGDRRGRIVAFGARRLEGDGPKYINSRETPLFQKGQLLYGMARAREAAAEGRSLLVVEGYMDVIACVSAGFTGAVAPLGTALTEAQILELWKLAPAGNRVPVLCFDGDNAGRRAAWRAVERVLPHLLPDHSVRIAFLPEGEDPDSLIRSAGTDALQTVLERALPLATCLWEMEINGRDLGSPESRAGLKAALEERCRTIADASVREYYRADMARRLSEAFAWKRENTAGGWNASSRTARGERRDSESRFWKRHPGAKGAHGGHEGAFVPFKRQPPIPASRIREHILLATLLNHPQLFDKVGEDFATLAFINRDYDRLRQAILETLSHRTDLDAAGLCLCLREQGFSSMLANLLSDATYIHASFARSETCMEKAYRGWQDVMRQVHQGRLTVEAQEAKRVLGANPTEANLARVMALEQELLETERETARAQNLDDNG